MQEYEIQIDTAVTNLGDLVETSDQLGKQVDRTRSLDEALKQYAATHDRFAQSNRKYEQDVERFEQRKEQYRRQEEKAIQAEGRMMEVAYQENARRTQA